MLQPTNLWMTLGDKTCPNDIKRLRSKCCQATRDTTTDKASNRANGHSQRRRNCVPHLVC